MKFSKEEIQNSMLLYAVTDRMWLKDGEGLTDVCRKVLENGATFLQIREKIWMKIPLNRRQRH